MKSGNRRNGIGQRETLEYLIEQSLVAAAERQAPEAVLDHLLDALRALHESHHTNPS